MPTSTSPCQQTSRGIRPLTLAIHLLVAGSAVTVLPVAAQTASEEDVLFTESLASVFSTLPSLEEQEQLCTYMVSRSIRYRV